jgi:hypothetical protein
MRRIQPLSDRFFDFPIGISPWRSELRRRNQLREGYNFSLLENSSDSYRFTAMAKAGKVEDIFRSFAALLPEESFFILEFYRDEEEPDEQGENAGPVLYYSPYLPTDELLSLVGPYFQRLIHDGFVGFGLANNQVGMELFYSEEKILTCFTGNHIRIMDLLGKHEIPYNARQQFTSDFGHDHLSLLCYRRNLLPSDLALLPEAELDYICFCQELLEQLEMYPVEDDFSFFLSPREQGQIAECLGQHPDYAFYADEDFGDLLLSWNDFVHECDHGFEGCLEDYQDGLRLRDLIQYVIDGVPELLARKLTEVVGEADGCLRRNLVESRKRFDLPEDLASHGDRFWYRGMVRNQGVDLRRDLIRRGWFQP